MTSRSDLRLPPTWIVVVALLSVTPVSLILLGLDLGITPPDEMALPRPGEPGFREAVYGLLAGDLLHTILEWSAFSVAFFTAIVALMYFRVHRDAVTLVLGVAVLAAGTVDAFHILAADRLIGSVEDASRFVPFTWFISRLFNSIIVLGGALLLLVLGGRLVERHSELMIGLCAVAGLLAFGTVYAAATAPTLPATHLPGAIATRPWDLIPLGLFLIAAVVVLPALHRRHPSAFSHALLVSMIPQMATQLHMAFGSQALYDAHFNAAHFLKILAYAVPFAGLALAYVQAHRRELAASVAQAEAESANRTKSAFMATMSHELRTPLNAILGYADLLQMGVPASIPRSAGAHVHRIHVSATHLLHLIDEILTFSRIEAGRERAEIERLRLEEITHEISAIVEPLAAKKHLDFRMDLNGAPETIETDPRKVRQILINLLGNAIKFTEEGEVSLTIAQTDGHIEFRVRDTGVGITAEDQDRLFEPFWQADGSTTRQSEGTGLGLPISQRFAALLGGAVTVESAPGEGSVFTLSLPLRARDGVA